MTIQFDPITNAYIRGPLAVPKSITFKGGSVTNFDGLPAETQAGYGYVSDLQYVALPEGAVLRNATWVRDGNTAIQQGQVVTASELQAEQDAAAAAALAGLLPVAYQIWSCLQAAGFEEWPGDSYSDVTAVAWDMWMAEPANIERRERINAMTQAMMALRESLIELGGAWVDVRTIAEREGWTL